MIRIENLSFSYSGNKNTIENVNLAIEEGKVKGILGTNGAGKSTMVKCINGMLKGKGEITIDDIPFANIHRKELAKKIAYVPQSEEATHGMVFDTVLLGRMPYMKWDMTEEDKNVVMEALEKLNIAKFATRYMDELSGGERQKVLLARALVQKPRFLLLDEPTSNLDPKNQQEILKLVKSICEEENIGIVVVLHDLNLALKYCDDFLFLRDGKVVAGGDMGIFTSETIKDVYNIDVEIIEHRGEKVVVAL